MYKSYHLVAILAFSNIFCESLMLHNNQNANFGQSILLYLGIFVSNIYDVIQITH